MKIKYEILQLQKLGKKQNSFIVSRIEKVGRIEITGKVYGPTTKKNCDNFLLKMSNQLLSEIKK